MTGWLYTVGVGLACGMAWFADSAEPRATSASQVGPNAKFKVTTGKKDDVVEIRSDKDQTVFAVRSPFGISQMVIERVEDKWPTTVVLRLHLKGLENFEVQSSKVTLHAAVSLQDGKPKVRLWKDGNENAVVDEKSPLWMPIRVLDADGKAARKLPLTEGYFEMTLPPALFADQPQSIRVRWIDFYR